MPPPEVKPNERTAARPNTLNAFNLLVGVVVLLVAWRLFLVGLTDASMWFDDDYSWRISREGLLPILTATRADVHPPLYYWLLWAWMTVHQSESLFVIRLSSALPALMTVAVTMRLAWLWLRSNPAAWAAGLFLASSGMMIFYARILRMYALVGLLLALSWWALWRLWGGRRGGVTAYALSLVAMAYTFYFAAFGVLLQVIMTLVVAPRKFGRLVWAGVAALVAFAPWLPSFIGQLGVARAQSGTEDAPALGKFLGTIPTGPDALKDFATLYSMGQPAYLLLLLVLAVVIGVGTPSLRRGLTLAVVWFAGFVGLLFTLNLLIPVYSHRYTTLALPGLALWVAVLIAGLRSRGMQTAVVAVMVAVGVVVYPVGFPEENVPHQELFRTINAGFRDGDRVWYNLDAGARGSSIFGAPGQYHLLQDASKLQPDGSDFVWEAPAEFDTVDDARRVWDVRPYYIEPPGISGERLLAGRAVTESYIYGDYTVRLYEAEPDDAPVSVGETLQLKVNPLGRDTYTAGDTLAVKLWWRVTEPLPLDYSRSLQLRDANGRVVVADDTTLQRGDDDAPLLTSAWPPSDAFTFTPESFTLPDDIPVGDYTLWLVVYHWATPDTPLADAIEVGALRVR
jgi:hypothetical protein